MVALAPPPAGTVTAVHVVPPFADRHTPEAVAAPATVPYITIAPPLAAAPVMPSTRPLPAARPSWVTPSRCQVVPLADSQTTGLALAALPPGHVGAGRQETGPGRGQRRDLVARQLGKLRVTDPVMGVLAGPDDRRTDRDPAGACPRRPAWRPGRATGRLARCRAARSGRCRPRRRTVSGGSWRRTARPPPRSCLRTSRPGRAWPGCRGGQRGGAGEVRRGRAGWRVSRVERRGSGPAPVVRACHHDHRDADGDGRHDRHRQARYPVAGPHGRREVPAEAGGEALFRRLVRRVAPAGAGCRGRAARPGRRGPAARRRAVVPACRATRTWPAARTALPGLREALVTRWLAAARAARAA